MRKLTLLIPIIVVSIILCISYSNKKLTLQEVSYQKELKVKEEQIESIKKLYQNNIIITKENENLKLDDSIKLVTLDNDTILAKDVFIKNSLVLSYSMFNCGDCVNTEFDNLKKYAHSFSEKIIIVAYFDRLRDAIFECKKMQKLGLEKSKFYVLISNNLGIPMDRYNSPYYFHINEDLTISNVLLPIKDNPKLSEFYLKYSFKNY